MAAKNVKQRSLNLNDEDYKLLTDYADRLGATSSYALRVILRSTLGGEAPVPLNQHSFAPVVPVEQPLQAGPTPSHPQGERDIVLPDPKQTSFAIPPKFRERGGMSIRDRQRMAGVSDIDLDSE